MKLIELDPEEKAHRNWNWVCNRFNWRKLNEQKTKKKQWIRIQWVQCHCQKHHWQWWNVKKHHRDDHRRMICHHHRMKSKYQVKLKSNSRIFIIICRSGRALISHCDVRVKCSATDYKLNNHKFNSIEQLFGSVSIFLFFFWHIVKCAFINWTKNMKWHNDDRLLFIPIYFAWRVKKKFWSKVRDSYAQRFICIINKLLEQLWIETTFEKTKK